MKVTLLMRIFSNLITLNTLRRTLRSFCERLHFFLKKCYESIFFKYLLLLYAVKKPFEVFYENCIIDALEATILKIEERESVEKVYIIAKKISITIYEQIKKLFPSNIEMMVISERKYGSGKLEDHGTRVKYLRSGVGLNMIIIQTTKRFHGIYVSRNFTNSGLRKSGLLIRISDQKFLRRFVKLIRFIIKTSKENIDFEPILSRYIVVGRNVIGRFLKIYANRFAKIFKLRICCFENDPLAIKDLVNEFRAKIRLIVNQRRELKAKVSEGFYVESRVVNDVPYRVALINSRLGIVFSGNLTITGVCDSLCVGFIILGQNLSFLIRQFENLWREGKPAEGKEDRYRSKKRYYRRAKSRISKTSIILYSNIIINPKTRSPKKKQRRHLDRLNQSLGKLNLDARDIRLNLGNQQISIDISRAELSNLNMQAPWKINIKSSSAKICEIKWWIDYATYRSPKNIRWINIADGDDVKIHFRTNQIASITSAAHLRLVIQFSLCYNRKKIMISWRIHIKFVQIKCQGLYYQKFSNQMLRISWTWWQELNTSNLAINLKIDAKQYSNVNFHKGILTLNLDHLSCGIHEITISVRDRSSEDILLIRQVRVNITPPLHCVHVNPPSVIIKSLNCWSNPNKVWIFPKSIMYTSQTKSSVSLQINAKCRCQSCPQSYSCQNNRGFIEFKVYVNGHPITRDLPSLHDGTIKFHADIRRLLKRYKRRVRRARGTTRLFRIYLEAKPYVPFGQPPSQLIVKKSYYLYNPSEEDKHVYSILLVCDQSCP